MQRIVNCPHAIINFMPMYMGTTLHVDIISFNNNYNATALKRVNHFIYTTNIKMFPYGEIHLKRIIC